MTQQRPRALVVGNWKMNLGEASAKALVAELLTSLPFDVTEFAVTPSFPCLRAVLDAAAGTSLAVGAQDLHWESAGAFTGGVSGSTLSEMGVRFVIVGHSERRALFGETDATVARKVLAAHRHGLTPIVCVGENEGQRDAGRTAQIVVGQVYAAFVDHAAASPPDIVVAYEPVWAIGTGRTPATDEITDAHAAIRRALSQLWGASSSPARVLYGGSVTAKNAATLLRAPEVDGALVGGASLEASSFATIGAAARPWTGRAGSC